jgi:hypothetical protein
MNPWSRIVTLRKRSRVRAPSGGSVSLPPEHPASDALAAIPDTSSARLDNSGLSVIGPGLQHTR